MANEFHIDRQFGVAIWIDVDKGIVINVHNEKPVFVNKMMKHYKGKSISFLKADFEKKMKPAHYNVRSTDVSNALKNVNAIDARLTRISCELNNLHSESDLRTALEAQKENVLKEKDERLETLENLQEYVKQIHGYDF